MKRRLGRVVFAILVSLSMILIWPAPAGALEGGQTTPGPVLGSALDDGAPEPLTASTGPISVLTNSAPTIISNDDPDAEVGSPYEVDYEATDPDGDLVQVKQTSLPTARSGMPAVWDGTYVYIFGGRLNGPGAADEILRYDPAIDDLTTMNATFPEGIAWSEAVWIGSEFFIFGGERFDSPTPPFDEIFRYDPGLDNLTLMNATIQIPTLILLNPASTYDGQFVHILGGLANDAIHRFDPVLDTLVTLNETLPVPRGESRAVLWQGEYYQLGGYSTGLTLTDEILSFDPTTETVTLLPEVLPEPVRGGGTFSDGCAIYYLGGYWNVTGSQVDTILRYDPGSGSITTMGSTLPTPRSDLYPAWTGAEALMFGYWLSNGTKMAEIVGYTPPDCLTWSLTTDASFLTIDPLTGNLTGTPQLGDEGTYWVNVSVSDGNGGVDWSNFTLTVGGRSVHGYVKAGNSTGIDGANVTIEWVNAGTAYQVTTISVQDTFGNPGWYIVPLNPSSPSDPVWINVTTPGGDVGLNITLVASFDDCLDRSCQVIYDDSDNEFVNVTLLDWHEVRLTNGWNLISIPLYQDQGFNGITPWTASDLAAAHLADTSKYLGNGADGDLIVSNWTGSTWEYYYSNKGGIDIQIVPNLMPNNDRSFFVWVNESWFEDENLTGQPEIGIMVPGTAASSGVFGKERSYGIGGGWNMVGWISDWDSTVGTCDPGHCGQQDNGQNGSFYYSDLFGWDNDSAFPLQNFTDARDIMVIMNWTAAVNPGVVNISSPDWYNDRYNGSKGFWAFLQVFNIIVSPPEYDQRIGPGYGMLIYSCEPNNIIVPTGARVNWSLPGDPDAPPDNCQVQPWLPDSREPTDFAVTSISPPPATRFLESLVNVTVTNNGPTSGTTSVSLFLATPSGWSLVASQDSVSVGVGTNTTVSLAWTPGVQGSHQLMAQVHGQSPADFEPANDTLTTGIWISPADQQLTVRITTDQRDYVWPGENTAEIAVKVTYGNIRITPDLGVWAWVEDPLGAVQNLTLSPVGAGLYQGQYNFSGDFGQYRTWTMAVDSTYGNATSDYWYFDLWDGGGRGVFSTTCPSADIVSGQTSLLQATYPISPITARLIHHDTGAVLEYPLFDDGLHEDGAASDGTHAYRLPAGLQAGTYQVDFLLADNYTREVECLLVVDSPDLIQVDANPSIERSGFRLFINSTLANTTLDVNSSLQLENISVGLVEHRNLTDGKRIEILVSHALEVAMHNATVAVDYVDADIPPSQNESQLGVWTWDTFTREWVDIFSGQDTFDDDIWGDMDHFSWFRFAEPPPRYSNALSPGLNLISFPNLVDSMPLHEALAWISGEYHQVWTYRAGASDPWLSWDAYRPAFMNDAILIDPSDALFVTVTGSLPADLLSFGANVNRSVNLVPGWNLVGYPTLNDDVSVNVALAGITWTMLETGVYPNHSTLDPEARMPTGLGYWIHVPFAQIWTVDW